MTYLTINPISAGITGGLIGLIGILWTTINGIMGKSNVAKWFEESVWGNYGYSVSWKGLFVGLVLGFVYGFVIWWFFGVVYNFLI